MHHTTLCVRVYLGRGLGVMLSLVLVVREVAEKASCYPVYEELHEALKKMQEGN